ncbi:hypothetical protein FRC03_008059 [Tulasnella sp. 419]|nr:hypothetical protein FRC03_008059 [Tulasnella sp. 419]
MQVVIAGSSNTQITPKIDQLGKESMAIPFLIEQVIDPKELAPSAHRNRIQAMTDTRLDKSQVEVVKTKAHGRERRDRAGSKTRRTYSSPCKNIAIKAQATCSIAQV